MSALGSLRITVVPADGKLKTQTSARGIENRSQPVGLHSFTIPGGLGPHKWADRSLLEEARAGMSGEELPLIVDTDGAALEASRANLFAVRDGALFTPPLDGRILPGVTRMRVLNLAGEVGIDAYETELSRADLLAAEEVFITGSVRGIERIRYVDGLPLSDGGDVTDRLATELWQAWTAAKAAL